MQAGSVLVGFEQGSSQQGRKAWLPVDSVLACFEQERKAWASTGSVLVGSLIAETAEMLAVKPQA